MPGMLDERSGSRAEPATVAVWFGCSPFVKVCETDVGDKKRAVGDWELVTEGGAVHVPSILVLRACRSFLAWQIVHRKLAQRFVWCTIWILKPVYISLSVYQCIVHVDGSYHFSHGSPSSQDLYT